MIRNDRGDHFLLITQNDHAVLAGELAARIGNARFDGPDPREPTLLGTAMHDAGWPLHDDAPTLNAGGLPLHVMEISAPLATRVWNESAQRAAAADSYAGLLVSLHVFALSSLAVMKHQNSLDRDAARHEMFLINQFQQTEIERQEIIRPQFGLRNDLPRHIGLADPGEDHEEDRLRANLGWLRAMDGISLDLCTGKRVFDRLPEVYPRVGPVGMELTMVHLEPGVLRIDPWPFSTSTIDLVVPARRVTAAPFANVEAFRQAYAAAAVFGHRVRVVR
ncbi:DUF3891 family protein [Humisphaera borealis]|uniref:DUF3891 family protein n=1 Tax=Humisphaera borealis TaxID=2807512 RepID=A0A7M2WWH2_9BACT|nr:DUF3891 family protein [Humisphaera borealis]QOV89845.1 DUF3891 family protein [Humisphaera borealis]